MSPVSVSYSFHLSSLHIDLLPNVWDPREHVYYYLHLLLLVPICDVVSSLLLRDHDRDILFLRPQLLILQRQLGREAAYGRLGAGQCSASVLGIRSGVRRTQTLL